LEDFVEAGAKALLGEFIDDVHGVVAELSVDAERRGVLSSADIGMVGRLVGAHVEYGAPAPY
jgi:uncharacterized membrane protein YeaQ/YmgE (transglycosylase-associated protein family)